MLAVIVAEDKTGACVKTVVDVKILKEVASIKGYTYTGQSKSVGIQRKELDNLPEFKELCGPMWDGDKVRYESWEVYNKLSN